MKRKDAMKGSRSTSRKPVKRRKASAKPAGPRKRRPGVATARPRPASKPAPKAAPVKPLEQDPAAVLLAMQDVDRPDLADAPPARWAITDLYGKHIVFALAGEADDGTPAVAAAVLTPREAAEIGRTLLQRAAILGEVDETPRDLVQTVDEGFDSERGIADDDGPTPS